MPIIFVHGVAERVSSTLYQTRWHTIKKMLRRFIAPAISHDPDGVTLLDAYWGDVGVQFAWNGASCPPSQVASLRTHPLASLASLGRKRDLWGEIGKRGISAPGFLLSRGLAMVRPDLNRQSAVFLGDAFRYFAARGSAEQPGTIPLRVLDVLAQAHTVQLQRPGEPLVVFSHSMGGQIIYDLVTHFLPRMPRYGDIHIDFWAATASQIGLFEEMKLFLVSDLAYGPGNPVPFPDRRFLKAWWNMWDPHDFLSFTVKNIIDDVDDSFFDSGLPVNEAHFGFLQLPSFYSLLAQKLRSGLHDA